MKLLLGILVIMLFAGNVNLDAQKNMKRMKSDSTSMKCDSACMRMWRHTSMAGMKYHRGMMPGEMNRMGQRPGMMARDGRGQYDRMAMNHGMRMIENIPDLTAKQKEDLTKIREEGRSQMQKLREKQQKEMADARDAQKKKVMSILTDEQKKTLLDEIVLK